MLQDAGMCEDHIEMLKSAGLVHEGKLAEVTKSSKCDSCHVVAILLIIR